MSAPALIREADAKRLLTAARVAGWRSCELCVDPSGMIRLIARESEAPAPDGAIGNWSDDDR